MGSDIYIIKGQIIGKNRVNMNASWNPIVKVDKWREVNILKNWLIKGLFLMQLLVLGAVILRKNHNLKL